MGMCTSDPLGQLTYHYGGQDVCKYFVCIKAEQYLDQAIPQLTETIHQKFQSCSKNLNKEFDSKQKTIRDYFDDILEQTLKESRIALEGIKQRQKKNQEQVFGLTNIHNKFIKLRLNKDQKLNDHEQNLLKILNAKKNQLKKQLNVQKPELPILEEMPFWLKNQVEQDGTRVFARQIKMEEERLLNILEKCIFLNDLEESIRREVGMEEADELSKAAQVAFERIKRNLTFFNNPRSCFV